MALTKFEKSTALSLCIAIEKAISIENLHNTIRYNQDAERFELHPCGNSNLNIASIPALYHALDMLNKDQARKLADIGIKRLHIVHNPWAIGIELLPK